MVPTRDCLQPKFGVKYHEPEDSVRKVGSITLGGTSYYSNPAVGHRMRRHDLEMRQLSEKINFTTYEGASSKETML
jgi:hypothetical protein